MSPRASRVPPPAGRKPRRAAGLIALSGLLLGERIASVQTIGALLLVCAGIAIVNRPAGKRQIPPEPRQTIK